MEKVIPRGIPTISYIRILNQEQSGQSNDIEIDGDFVSIMESGQPTTRHEVAHVFERGISDQEFCEATIGQEAGASMGAALNPINAFVEDATSAVIMLIGSKFTKKWQFLKRIFLPFAANEFFACLSDKEQQGAEMFQYEALFSAFEIQDEVITDLVRPSIRDLSITVSSENGVIVQGASKERIVSEESLRQLFIETCDNRCSHTQPVGGNIDTSTAIWEITLNQKELDGDVVLYNTSRLIIIDIPSLNPLCHSNSDIQILEGHKLHRSLFTFFDCSQKLSSLNLAPLAPFRSSKLTHYLSELLGGNSVVVALGLLHSGEPQVSRKVLEIMNNLTNSRHYPIAGKEMSELVQGLMMKYRSMLINTEDSNRLQSIENNSNNLPPSHPAFVLLSERNKDLERRLEEAQKQYAEQKINSEQIETDAVRLYEAIQLLKSKYATILEEKKELATELIKREEEKLEMARGLVELKLAHSQSVEKSEKELFEVTSNMLNMKNEIYELDNQEQILKAQLAELQEKFNQTTTLYEKERESGIIAKSELHEVRQQLERAEVRNVEIGAELVTLLNTKNSLEEQIVVLRKQCADLEESLHADTSDLAALRSENSSLEVKVNELEREYEDSQRELAEANIQIEKLRIESERNRLQFEQSANDYLREKDQSMKRETQSIMTEVHHLQNEKEQLLVCIRREERKKRDALRDVKRVSDEKDEILKKFETSQNELLELRAAYRKYLGEILEEQSSSTSVILGSNGIGNGNKETLTPSELNRQQHDTHRTARSGISNGDNSEMVWQAVVDSYLQTEKKLLQEVERGNDGLRQMSIAIRKLYDYYRSALDIIEDNCPQAMPQEVLSSETVLFQPSQQLTSDNKNGNSLSLLSESQVDQQIHSLRLKLQEAEASLLAEQERYAAVIAKYRKSLQKTEKELEKKILECSQLSQKLEVLTVTMNEKQHGNDEANDKIESVSRRLEAQMQELRKKEGPNNELKKQINALKAQCTLLTEENREMRALLLRGGGGGSGGGNTGSGRENDGQKGNQDKIIKNLEEYIKKLEHDSDSALLHQLREVESRNSALISRNSGMEEELRSYKAYMREAIIQYKRQIQDLQNQITVLQIADFESTNLKDNKKNQISNQKNQNETRFPEIPRLKSAS